MPKSEDVKREVKEEKPYQGGKETSPKKRVVVGWRPDQDAILLRAAEELIMSGIWDKVKDDPLVSGKGSNGVRVRIKTLYKAINAGKSV